MRLRAAPSEREARAPRRALAPRGAARGADGDARPAAGALRHAARRTTRRRRARGGAREAGSSPRRWSACAARSSSRCASRADDRVDDPTSATSGTTTCAARRAHRSGRRSRRARRAARAPPRAGPRARCAPPTSSTASAVDDVRRRRRASSRHAHPELGLLCTGPWPPYSFADGDGHEGQGARRPLDGTSTRSRATAAARRRAHPPDQRRPGVGRARPRAARAHDRRAAAPADGAPGAAAHRRRRPDRRAGRAARPHVHGARPAHGGAARGVRPASPRTSTSTSGRSGACSDVSRAAARADHACPPPGGLVDRERPAGRLGAVAQAEDAGAARRVGAAAAVVGDLDAQDVAVAADATRAPRRPPRAW